MVSRKIYRLFLMNIFLNGTIEPSLKMHKLFIFHSLADERYASAKKIRLTQDNLNTHVKSSLYKAFPPAEARRILDKFEFHYTPKHGSWLNIAEIELSVLSLQCLDRRIPDKETLISEVAAWENRRNALACKCNWQFTTEDARIKLARLYPVIDA
jgi:hypothetical protein